jgi:hypothetical protein
MWSMGLPSKQLQYPFDTTLVVFKYFLAFWNNKILQALLYFPYPNFFWNQSFFQGTLVLFSGSSLVFSSTVAMFLVAMFT